MGRDMGDPKKRVQTADREAAAWHARLGAPSVSTETIEAFFAWRSRPGNADAYRRVDRVWAAAGEAADHPDMRRALDEAMRRRGADRKPRRSTFGLAAAGLAAVGAALALAVAGWVWTQDRAAYATGVGEQRLVRLDDGSTVTLDTDSRIRVRYGEERRLVELESGQALFAVAADADRPFVVLAGEARVTAVGTVFDVRRRASGARVVLVSGVVDVAGPGQGAATRMRAGTSAEIDDRGAAVRAADVAAETGWTDGRIVFRDAPLGEAVAEVNRYLTRKVALGEGAPASARVSGVFRTGDREAFVSTVTEAFGLEAARGPDGSVRLEPGPVTG